MRFYTIIPKSLKQYYTNELTMYKKNLDNGFMEKAWRHLERAHIIGQRYPLSHSYVHWKMLQFGIKIKNFREIIGQIPRLIFGGIKSFVGIIPVGNPGGSNVPPLKPFPIDDDINEIFKKSGINFN